MREFSFLIRDEIGIHARPAGLLVNAAKKFESRIEIRKDTKIVEVTKLLALLNLGVKCGDFVTVTADGVDEDAAIGGIRAFFEEHFS